MDRIAEASKQVVSGVEAGTVENWVTIYIMGRAYQVPADLTILTAMEYAGYKFVRGVGCRQGFCGACATLYRKEGEYKLQAGMACQTRVEDGMYLVQIPFTPAEKPSYDIAELDYDVNTLFEYYPELARCVSCNTCTKACPQDLEVMDYVQAGIKGDFGDLAEESFDCIQCGLCAIRCPSEIVQYNVAQLGRRLYGRYDSPEPEHLTNRLEEIDEGKFEQALDEITSLGREELEKMYAEREREQE
ncbi:4Fe-4S dicluster domain-containing protein [Candidatus Fermentibacteria bacterium]|nr:4Fe-4S dicluster domain-containing protein [Candidatus Fermentibacteria bacterium]